ncbi:hypothetical protein LCGC14_1731830 [marine sediment metagenome]|uniref:Uncharacterized protein n=1 Tax=marine sediment metagenome TaxID=412755 RepID=A0A0F9K907_9ZZZZ
MATDPDFLEILNETCTIQVWTDGGEDDYNQPINAGWVPESTDVACRFETKAGVEIIEGKKVVIESVNLMLLPDTTITEARRVIRDADSQVYSILLVNHADEEQEEHHIEAILDHVKVG